jgi:hypothetical protein
MRRYSTSASIIETLHGSSSTLPEVFNEYFKEMLYKTIKQEKTKRHVFARLQEVKRRRMSLAAQIFGPLLTKGKTMSFRNLFKQNVKSREH